MECVELQTTRLRRPIALAASLASPVLLQGEDDHDVHIGDDDDDLGDETFELQTPQWLQTKIYTIKISKKWPD